MTKEKNLSPWKKSYDQSRQHIKKQRHYFANKGPSSQNYGFSSVIGCMGPVMYGYESWTIKNAGIEEPMVLNCSVGEDSWESLDCKEIQPVNPKGNQSWIFIGRTDAEAEAPILWPPDARSWLTGKDPDAGKDWRQEKKGIYHY